MTSNEANGIQKDMVEEAVRVAEKAEQEDVALRLLGGVAIKVRAREGLQPAFERQQRQALRGRRDGPRRRHDRQGPHLQGGAGRWHATLLENRHEFGNEVEVKGFEGAVRRRRYYPFRTDPGEMTDLEEDEKLRDELFPSGDPHNR